MVETQSDLVPLIQSLFQTNPSCQRGKQRLCNVTYFIVHKGKLAPQKCESVTWWIPFTQSVPGSIYEFVFNGKPLHENFIMLLNRSNLASLQSPLVDSIHAHLTDVTMRYLYFIPNKKAQHRYSIQVDCIYSSPSFILFPFFILPNYITISDNAVVLRYPRLECWLHTQSYFGRKYHGMISQD